MGRAKIISAVSGKPNRYLVEDDLGKSYEVESSVDGFNYVAGKYYRLFTPDGEYRPSAFRLLPYSTGKRWKTVADIGRDYPATASAHFFYKDQMALREKRDRNRTVAKVLPGKLKFTDGGCAKVADSSFYKPGDCVAVIHDKPVAGDPDCLSSGRGDPWVAGFGCNQSPAPACPSLFEHWNSYPNPSADLSSGEFVFRKPTPNRNEINGWQAKVAKVYAAAGQPYGAPATVLADGALKMDSLPIELAYVDSQTDTTIFSTYPSPIPFRVGFWDPMIFSPPVIVRNNFSLGLECGGKPLLMTVNLLTQDVQDYGIGGFPTEPRGLQIPSSMILVFGGKPWPDYIKTANINAHLYEFPNGSPKYASGWENNLDRSWKLVYTAPGSRNFSNFRGSFAGTGAGQYGLYMPTPGRTAYGSYKQPSQSFSHFRNKFNAPMSDFEIGFNFETELYFRVFDVNGTDITPPTVTGFDFGMHPGYFEIPAQNNIHRNVRDDFLSAFPYMANPAVNPSGNLPSLTAVVFYVQGKIYQTGFDPLEPNWRANPSKLECQALEFAY